MGFIIIVLNILLPPVPLMGTKHNAASLALLQGNPYGYRARMRQIVA